ncbi:hypothetical protein F66182_9668 [Fusarium sp. NRRL 66182]|nr:hypothetical protein F66182_9668 [Fusarium sp. NRRL 66182]
MALLTESALFDLNRRTAHLTVTSSKRDDDLDDCASHYSLSDLECDEWLRRIPASEVRRQAELVPDVPERDHLKYPRPFYNKESLPLEVSGPWKEYPLCLNGRYMRGNPGPARVIVNPSEPGGCAVVYHPRCDAKSALHAKYRPKGYRRGLRFRPSPDYTVPSISRQVMDMLYTQQHNLAYQNACQNSWVNPLYLNVQ